MTDPKAVADKLGAILAHLDRLSQLQAELLGIKRTIQQHGGTMDDSQAYTHLIRLIRAARGAEAGGFYGLSKLLWALAYRAEIQAAGTDIPRGDALEAALDTIQADLVDAGTPPAVLEALAKGRAALRANQPIAHTDIPDVYVSRSTGDIYLGDPPPLTPIGEHRLGLRTFNPIWYFDLLTPAEAIAALEAGAEAVQAALDSLSAYQLEISPAAGEWSMRELLNHWLFAQELLAARVDKLLTEDNPTLKGLAVWALPPESASVGDILERYRDSREAILARLRALPPADWWRSGWHSEFGQQTVLAQVTYFARHEFSHLPQAQTIRNGLEA